MCDVDDLIQTYKATHDISIERQLLSLIKSPDMLYNYIKSGYKFDDYVKDFEDGSVLSGMIVGKLGYLCLIIYNGNWDNRKYMLLNLDTFTVEEVYNKEESILEDWSIQYKSLDDYYNNVMGESGVCGVASFLLDDVMYQLEGINNYMKHALSQDRLDAKYMKFNIDVLSNQIIALQSLYNIYKKGGII